MIETSKQRAYLRSLAMLIEPSFNIGKENLTEGSFSALSEALEANELVKINVLKNSTDDIREMASILSENTSSEVVEIIGRKIVLFKVSTKEKNRKIKLPPKKK